MMKKIFWAFLFISLLTMGLSGCSGILPNDDSQKEGIPTTGPETPGSETPGSGTPGSETPGSETPESKTPGSESSETGETSDDEQETDHFASYYGTWEVKDYQSASVSTLSLEEMESFRGKKITYQADSILLDGENVTADDVAYETDLLTYDYDSLTEAYHANLGEWWNNISEVTCVTIDSNESFFGNQFFTADADTIWIYYEGVFFLAKSVNE